MDKRLIIYTVVVLLVLSVFIYPVITDNNQKSYDMNYSVDDSNTKSNEYSQKIYDSNVTIDGTITGANSGLKPVVDSYSINDDELNVKIGFKSDNTISNPVITTYKYTVEFKNTGVNSVNVEYVDNIK